jgi:hypothetical protein
MRVLHVVTRLEKVRKYYYSSPMPLSSGTHPNVPSTLGTGGERSVHIPSQINMHP